MDSKSDGKASSLKWAIGELSKQREELEGKLKVARKRDETSALIDEVHAQKEALEKRISSLQEGLSVSSELVEDEVDSLEETISAVDEKLGLAQERLEALEQEEYLEELGRKLNGDQYSETDFEEPSSEDELPDLANEASSPLSEGESSPLSDTDPQLHPSVESSPTPVLIVYPQVGAPRAAAARRGAGAAGARGAGGGRGGGGGWGWWCGVVVWVVWCGGGVVFFFLKDR